MAKSWGVNIVAMLLGLLLMAPETMQLNVNHPLFDLVQKVNVDAGPFLGLVLSNGRDEKILKRSGYFVPSESTPFVTIAGRKFNIGKFNGVSTIYVNSGSPLTAIGVTVQILIDTFNIKGIINYGDAGAVSNQVFIADVIVPSSVAYTGSWKWEKYNTPVVVDQDLPQPLVFSDYNVPKEGYNLLGHIVYQTSKFYTPSNSKKETFWFPVHSQWLDIASTIKDVKLEGCSHRACRLNAAHVVHGAKAASSDIYLLNTAYAEFLNKNVNATVVDTESAAVVSTAIANGLPHIVIRGTSDRPGLSFDRRLAELASKNALNVVAQFIELISSPSYGSVGVY